LYAGWKARERCPGWRQLPGVTGVEPGPRFFVGEIFAGKRGYHRLMDIVFPVSRLVMGKAFVMDQVICPVKEFVFF
jgi:hypothetical protein